MDAMWFVEGFSCFLVTLITTAYFVHFRQYGYAVITGGLFLFVSSVLVSAMITRSK